MVALCLLASVGVLASGAAYSIAKLVRAARSEAAGLVAATDKMEELLATSGAPRTSGNDEVVVDGLAVARVWRVVPDQPVSGVTRLEVTARWLQPTVTLLTVVAVAP